MWLHKLYEKKTEANIRYMRSRGPQPKMPRSTHCIKWNATFTWSLWLLTLPAVVKQHDHFPKTALTYSVSSGLFCVLPAPLEKKKKTFTLLKHDTMLTNCSNNESFAVSRLKAFCKPLNISTLNCLHLKTRQIDKKGAQNLLLAPTRGIDFCAYVGKGKGKKKIDSSKKKKKKQS